MLSLVTLPPRSILTTLPSAGETIILGSVGISRAGFRKKNATNAKSNSNKIPARYKPNTAARQADIRSGTINLNASLWIMVWLKGERGKNRGQTGVSGCVPETPVCPRFSRYVDGSVRSETSGSWSSSGLSNGVSSSSVGSLPDDPGRSYGGDYAIRRVALRIACVPPPDGEILDWRTSSVL